MAHAGLLERGGDDPDLALRSRDGMGDFLEDLKSRSVDAVVIGHKDAHGLPALVGLLIRRGRGVRQAGLAVGMHRVRLVWQKREGAMRMKRLGASGLQVSELCLGCMTYGEPSRGGHPWTLGVEESRPLIRAAVEAGITFLDTANVYSDGSSEEMLGDYLWTIARRDEIVLATKVHGVMEAEPQMAGLSRRAILHNIDASLRRLKTDPMYSALI
eukprot:Opistho-1_new@69156